MRKKRSREKAEDVYLMREFDFRKAVRNPYAGKVNHRTRITLRDRSGRVVRVTTVGEALASR